MKTIYDPCPRGWKVMSKQAWFALTDNEQPADAVIDVSKTGRGIWLDGKWFFPLTGGAQQWHVSNGNCSGTTWGGSCATYYVDGPDYYDWGHVCAFVTETNFPNDETKRGVTCKSQNTYSDQGAAVRCIRIEE